MPEATDRFEHLKILQELRDELFAAADTQNRTFMLRPAFGRGCRVV